MPRAAEEDLCQQHQTDKQTEGRVGAGNYRILHVIYDNGNYIEDEDDHQNNQQQPRFELVVSDSSGAGRTSQFQKRSGALYQGAGAAAGGAAVVGLAESREDISTLIQFLVIFANYFYFVSISFSICRKQLRHKVDKGKQQSSFINFSGLRRRCRPRTPDCAFVTCHVRFVTAPQPECHRLWAY